MESLSTLISRLREIGIEIELAGNYPWLYLNKINGIRVKEKLDSEHGFVIGYYPKPGQKFIFNNITETFKIIRKYVTKRT